jgi:hypothetical protein
MSRLADSQMLNVFNDLIARAQKLGQKDNDPEAKSSGDSGETNGPRQPLDGRPNRHNANLDSASVDKAVEKHKAAK